MTSPTPEKDRCQDPGRLIPIIDRNKCEAKGDCVSVCPYQVLGLLPVPAGDWAGMSWLGRLKTRVHGGRQAYAIEPDACHACGQCVAVCPEHAIQLRRPATER